MKLRLQYPPPLSRPSEDIYAKVLPGDAAGLVRMRLTALGPADEQAHRDPARLALGGRFATPVTPIGQTLGTARRARAGGRLRRGESHAPDEPLDPLEGG